MKAIAKNIHIVWIGGDLPDRNRSCVITFPQKNPDWNVTLWFDRNQLLTGLRRRLTKEYYEKKNPVNSEGKGVVTPEQWAKVQQKIGGQADDDATVDYLIKKFGKNEKELYDMQLDNWVSLKDFCKANRITLRSVNDISASKTFPIYRNEMVSRGTNFGAASDVLRIEILDTFGGIYFDTDVICTEPIGSVICHQSYPRFSAVDSLWVGKNKSVTGDQWRSDDWWKANVKTIPKISNSIIASHAKCNGLKEYRKQIMSNYKQLNSEDFRKQYLSNIREKTIEMSGPTAATVSSGYKKAKDKAQAKSDNVYKRTAQESEGARVLGEELLVMRDNWYFPMHLVSDQYFHDWLE
jgi:mannosyltransferase OCH1-like enzyme